jgi:hypothetical protein
MSVSHQDCDMHSLDRNVVAREGPQAAGVIG